MKIQSSVLLVASLFPGVTHSFVVLPHLGKKTTQSRPTCQLAAHRIKQQLAQTLLVTGLVCSIAIAPPSLADDSRSVYWAAQQLDAPREERIAANEKLLDYAVGTINTMYYDNSGGAMFQPRDFYETFRTLRDISRGTKPADHKTPRISLETREGAVEGLKWLAASLQDPFSAYLTRDELKEELTVTGKEGFLGLGALVEASSSRPELALYYPATSNAKALMTATRVANLPVVSAIAPNSPAERAGLTVGDRIVSVGSERFLGYTREEVAKTLRTKYSAENYIGYPDLKIAKPVWRTLEIQDQSTNVVVGYRTSHVRLPTTSVEPFVPENGNSIVQYSLIKDSILSASSKVGYIRLTRFSRASTDGYLKAITELEAAGAESFIIDLRNNYGGIIQEAMLTASTLLRDPHAVLCYTMNSRGGFTPHDAEEYIVDKRYPGYLLSTEDKKVNIEQVRRDSPDMFENDGVNWVPPSSFASLHEQRTKRGMHIGSEQFVAAEQAKAQKKIVLLINEGTASAAEVFASSLHDNGRTVALVGTKTFGKGLIQHTFPMPDGGGLRLTCAEYLTPMLKHVTKVGSARFDTFTGALVGGGIQPDIVCDSQQGIPGKVGADLCVSVALDALEEASYNEPLQSVGVQHAIRAGVARDTF